MTHCDSGSTLLSYHASHKTLQTKEHGASHQAPRTQKQRTRSSKTTRTSCKVRIDTLRAFSRDGGLVHYILDATVWSRAQFKLPVLLVLDRGSSYTVMRRSALCRNWRPHIVQDAALPHVRDANSTLLSLQRVVRLRVPFGHVLYRINFFSMGHFSCPVLGGTQSMNRNVEAIWGIQLRVLVLEYAVKTRGWEKGTR